MNAGMWGAGVAVAFALMTIGSERAQAPAREAGPAGALPVWAYPVSPACAAAGGGCDGGERRAGGTCRGECRGIYEDADCEFVCCCRTGFRARIRRCLRWSRWDAGRLCTLARIAISRAGWDGLRTRAWRGCRRPIWKSRWRISGTVCGAVRNRAWDRRAG